jgi:hypothetical protein
VLLWDVFTSRRCGETKVPADELGIKLEFVSPGMTACCQPLDRRIFENFKSRARARFSRFWTQNQNLTMQNSIGMLLQDRKSISQFEVLTVSNVWRVSGSAEWTLN